MNALSTLEPKELRELTQYLRRYALSRLREPERVDDLVQETLFAAVEARASFDGRSSLRTWLVSILRFKIADAMRAAVRDRRHFVELPDGDESGGPNVPAEAAADEASSDPAAALARKQLRAALDEGLRRIPRRAADALVLCDLHGADTQSACRALGVKENNLWVILHRGRKALRMQIEARGARGAV